MLRSHAKMNRAIESLADEYANAIETEARKVLDRHKSLAGFAAAMGTESFYRSGDGLPLDYDSTPMAGRAVLDMAADYLRAFGSPGLQVHLPERER